mmetsp:Transcript_12726/g.32086  ORF Transcript_12726/g.32086 Transcript_12726/m.32086 type:complete len:397 (+) Transcript_12726:3-1193(+)
MQESASGLGFDMKGFNVKLLGLAPSLVGGGIEHVGDEELAPAAPSMGITRKGPSCALDTRVDPGSVKTLLSIPCDGGLKLGSPEPSPCSRTYTLGSRSPAPSPTWSFMRRRKTAQAGTVTRGSLMAALRGRRMKEHVRDLQLLYQQESLRKRVHDEMTRASGLETLRKHFSLWVQLHASMKACARERAMIIREGAVSAFEGLPCPGWRVEEEYRRRRRQFLQRARKSGVLAVCFRLWHALLEESRTLTPQKAFMALFSDSPSHRQAASSAGGHPTMMQRFEDSSGLPIGSHLCDQTADSELLRQLRVLERLYETRVGAAERLLASYVLLHRAVKPISKLWWLSFDMDRSESRLRVASTPAPVPFVESLLQVSAERGGAYDSTSDSNSGIGVQTVSV